MPIDDDFKAIVDMLAFNSKEYGIVDLDYNLLCFNDNDFEIKLNDFLRGEYRPLKKCYEYYSGRKEKCETCNIECAISNRENKESRIIPFECPEGNVLGVALNQIECYYSNLYKKIVNEKEMGIAIYNIDGNLKYSNDLIKSFLGELVAKNIYDYLNISKKDLLTSSKEIKRKLQKEDDVCINILITKQSCEEIRVVAYELINKFEKLNNDEELVVSQRFKNLIKGLNESVWIIDKDGIICDVNDQAQIDSKYTREELLGMNIADLDKDMKNEEYSKYYHEIYRALHMQYIRKHVQKDGNIIDVYVYGVPFNLDGKEYVVATTRNITSEKENEKIFIEARNSIKRFKDMRIKFFLDMAHELRNPMNGILGFLQLLDSTNLDEIQHKYVQWIKMSSNRLFDVVEDMLDIARIEHEEIIIAKTTFDIKKMIKSIKEEYTWYLDEKDLDIIIKTSKWVPDLIIGDMIKLKRILKNIIDILLKCSTIGNIFIKIDCENLKKDEINLTISINGTRCYIDTSEFQRFIQGKKIKMDIEKLYLDETELGLRSSYFILKQMCGNIEVTKTDGNETIFIVSLPSKLD